MALTYQMTLDNAWLDELRRERQMVERYLSYGIDMSVQQSPSVQREPVPAPVYEQTGEGLFASLLAKPSNITIAERETKKRRFILCGCRNISCPASHWEGDEPGSILGDASADGKPTVDDLREEYGEKIYP